MDIVTRLSKVVKDCPDFPREGILFKDIMPIFNDPDLVRDTCQSLVDQVTRIPYWNVWNFPFYVGLKIIYIYLPNFCFTKNCFADLLLLIVQQIGCSSAFNVIFIPSQLLSFNMWLWVEMDYQFIVSQYFMILTFYILVDIMTSWKNHPLCHVTPTFWFLNFSFPVHSKYSTAIDHLCILSMEHYLPWLLTNHKRMIWNIITTKV